MASTDPTTTSPSDPTVDTTPLNPTTSRERRDSLEKHLASRPAEQDLKDRHILLDTTAAPALQAKQAELERSRVSDSLRKGLEKRPEREELVEKNILPDDQGGSVAPGLQGAQRDLERHMRADSLEGHLKKRPEAGELVEKGILKGEWLTLSYLRRERDAEGSGDCVGLLTDVSVDVADENPVQEG